MELSKKADEVRVNFLQGRAQEAAKEKNTQAEKEIKSLIETEKSRAQNKRMKKMVKPTSGGGPNSILIPAITEYQQPHQKDFDFMDIEHIWQRIEFDNGEDIQNWTRVTDQHLVPGMLLKWQRRHFTQANDTPFASEAWRQKLQDEEVQEAILAGTFPILNELPLEANEILQGMKRDDRVKIIPDHTTVEDFKAHIKKVKETRSSSASGRHYRHYKVLYHQDQKYLEVIHGILITALRNNIILDRWKKTITALIEKKTGTPFIHKFRAIHIVERGLQFLSKYFYACKMIHNAESHGLISDEQYGGRKHQMAQSVVINNICYYNVSHQTLISCAFMDDDARACYDRIITSLSSLECRWWGLSKTVTDFTTQFIEEQKYHVRSAYGVSNDHYKFDPLSPTQGSGQGLSWAGPRWTNTGSNISDIMNRSNTGMQFVDPTGNIEVKKCGDFFVDDTATGVSANHISDGKTTLEHLRKDEQKHALLLYATGHMLALYKCLFYYFMLKISGTRFVHTTIDETPGELEIKPKHEGFMQRIRRLDPSVAHKTLGCHIAIDMNQTKQLEILTSMIKRWVAKIQSSPLSSADKIYAYKAYLEKMLLYVLPTRSFNYQQCKQLDKHLSPMLFNAHCIQQNCNRSVLYMSHELGGLQIFSIFHLQGVAKLQFLFKHLRAMDTTGKLLLTSLRYTQLELGVSKPFLSLIFYKYCNFVTPTWITNLWQ